MHATCCFLGLVLSAVLVAAPAAAEDRDLDLMPSPRLERAFEVSMDLGYGQGFGNVGAGMLSLGQAAGPGAQLGIGLGYRFTPSFMLGIYVTGAGFVRGPDVDPSTSIDTSAAGIQVNYHIAPYAPFDPWIGIGTGWRGYWLDNSQGLTALQGLELARLQVGLDIATVEGVTFGPMIGVDLSTLLTESGPGGHHYTAIGSPDVNTFLFCGLVGRFDLRAGRD